MRQFLLTMALVAVLLAGCANEPTTETITDPLALVAESAALLRAADTFRIDVIQEGPDYQLGTAYGSVVFRRASAQYVAPGVMQAKVRVIAFGLPIEVDVFARGAEQWYRAVWTNGVWLNEAFQEGFNPATLIAEDTGIQQALSALIDLTYTGTTTLESGAQVHQLDAIADGPAVSALLGGLIEPLGTVDVRVYVQTESRYPVRFVVTEYDSPFVEPPAEGETNAPVVWIIEIFDINGAPEVDDLPTPAPNNLLSPLLDVLDTNAIEATAEVTAEATAEATIEPSESP